MKMNTYSILEQERQFELDLSYAEFLKDTQQEPSSDELDDMEKVFCKAKIIKTHKHLHPLNNLYYQPLQEA